MKIDVYKVDNSVPVPSDGDKIPIHLLEVGESFLFPIDERPRVQSLASQVKKRTGKNFTVRKQDELVGRVWRTE